MSNEKTARKAKPAEAAAAGVAPRTRQAQPTDVAALKAFIPEFPGFEHDDRAVDFDLAAREDMNKVLVGEEELTQALLHVWPRASDTLVVLFRGIGRRGSGLPKRRWGNLFNSGAHVLVLNDESRCFYGKGVAAVGDSRQSTMEFIRQLQQALGCTRLFTCGSSAGGTGAILYGTLLGAERILAFSPVTAVQNAFYQNRDTKAPDSQRVLKRMRRLQRLFKTEDQFDCREVIEQTNPASKMRVHYPTGLYWDRMWGENLQGLPQVELFPHDGISEHSLINDAGDQSIAPVEIKEFFQL